jgi:hypothetical protein
VGDLLYVKPDTFDAPDDTSEDGEEEEEEDEAEKDKENKKAADAKARTHVLICTYMHPTRLAGDQRKAVILATHHTPGISPLETDHHYAVTH